jgi:hypothetical protein
MPWRERWHARRGERLGRVAMKVSSNNCVSKLVSEFTRDAYTSDVVSRTPQLFQRMANVRVRAHSDS